MVILAVSVIVALGSLSPAVASAEPEPGVADADPSFLSDVSVALERRSGLYLGAYASSYSRTGIRRAGPELCVWSYRRRTSTILRDGRQIPIRRDTYEGGCLLRSHVKYRFDPVTWRAEAAATIPTEVSVVTYEGRNQSRRSSRTTRSRATVELRWQGRGVPSPYLWPAPVPCVAVCAPVSVLLARPADVHGTITLRGQGVTTELPRGVTGLMRWGARP